MVSIPPRFAVITNNTVEDRPILTTFRYKQANTINSVFQLMWHEKKVMWHEILLEIVRFAVQLKGGTQRDSPRARRPPTRSSQQDHRLGRIRGEELEYDAAVLIDRNATIPAALVAFHRHGKKQREGDGAVCARHRALSGADVALYGRHRWPHVTGSSSSFLVGLSANHKRMAPSSSASLCLLCSKRKGPHAATGA